VRAQVELTSECPECRTQGVWLELYDPAAPATALGLPAEARCRLCGAARVGQVEAGSAPLRAGPWPVGECPFCAHTLDEGDLSAHACRACGAKASTASARAGEPMGQRDALERALRALMADEGDDDLDGFLRRAFGATDLAELGERYARARPVDTALDGGTAFLTGAVARATTEPRVADLGRPRTVMPDDRRAMLLALVSVLMADGQRDPREMPLVESFLKAEGLAPLSPWELRVHRPVEIAARVPVARRAELVSLMVQLAYADGVADPMEVRVLRAFADAWAVPQDEVDRMLETFRLAQRSRQRRLLDRLRAFFLTD
jgi:uncharacterized tellurite resistance protein B-like protein